MPPYDQNPYAPTLREAWQRGWRAWTEGCPRPTQQLSGGGKKAQAWIDGYKAAEEQDVF